MTKSIIIFQFLKTSNHQTDLFCVKGLISDLNCVVQINMEDITIMSYFMKQDIL